jgi:hypothetical protein
MRYRNRHIEVGKGVVSCQDGAFASVSYRIGTSEVAPGNSGVFSPVFIEVRIQHIEFLDDPKVLPNHSGEPLILTMQDGRKIEAQWQSGWHDELFLP